MCTVFAPLYHFEKKQKTGVSLNPDTGSYLRSAAVKMGAAERGKESKYWQVRPLTPSSTPLKWVSIKEKGLKVQTSLELSAQARAEQAPMGLLVSIRNVVEENGPHGPRAAKSDLLLCLLPWLLTCVPQAAPSSSNPAPGAMRRGTNSCTYLQPHECKTRERALWVSAARARELPEIILCIAVPSSSLGLRTCCSPLHPAGLGSCRALGQGSPAGDTGGVSVSLPAFIQPWFCGDPVGCRRASAPGWFRLHPLEKFLCFQLCEAKGRWWVGPPPGSNLTSFWRE